jgi:[glutamine synthetase] adenylyltransferase / [glutamine synthetase]-adenylyl-L-tyrosine phosphorylase
MKASLGERIKTHYPEAPDRTLIAHFWADLGSAGRGLALHKNLIEAIATGSPFLRAAILQHSGFAIHCLASAPEATLAELCASCRDSGKDTDFASIGRALRHLKAKAALLIALADIGAAWSLEEVTAALTSFADAALQAATEFLLVEAHRGGKLVAADSANPATQSAYAVLAMGKHGAHELNYSSDIDLIIVFDSERNPIAGTEEPSTFYVKLTRRLVNLLQDITEDGYVFRVDLRLRPDPRATQVAIAMEAAAVYYENQGQNWERAAMIKARAVAGDITLGEEFLNRMRPFIWRKYLDFAAIADVQSLKRQINAVKGHGEIAVPGHNLKLGRGGIREIEFFVQTQQLIAGGRNPQLRGRSTLAMLDQLAAADWITQTAADELKDCYRFLRMLEHRVQMVDDQQSHALPNAPEALARFARFAGFASVAELSEKLLATLQTVSRHYQALFTEAGDLGVAGGNLVFTGGEDDPGTLQTLTGMGFQAPAEIAATIRSWHFGRYAAMRAKRSRELLTELMPSLLQALAQTRDPDATFHAFDRFLQGLPSSVQLFSMLKASPDLLQLLARILGTAPRLAQNLSDRPRILEAVLDPHFFGPMPTQSDIAKLIEQQLPPSLVLEEAMDRARVLARELNFRVGVRVISETVSAAGAGEGFSRIADGLIGALHEIVTAEIERRHGKIAGGTSAVVAFGKLGSHEMTASSDLDLMLIYDHDTTAGLSDGARPLSGPQYYARLTQRLVTALAAPTAEGTLYDVDMRLRPSGSKGPIAASLASFKTYQAESAWTWEKLALTRARVVSAPKALKARLEAEIQASLASPRDRNRTLRDVREMRALMLREKPAQGIWDIKNMRGGLVDIEFIAQTFQLLHAANNLNCLANNTMQAVVKLREYGFVKSEVAADLEAALDLYHRITQVLRLCVDGPFVPEKSMSGLNEIVASAAQMPDIATTQASLLEHYARVSNHFDSLLKS